MNRTRKAILIKTDGYSINHSFYDNVENAKSAMKAQYEALMPEELMEAFEDLCYCGENGAMLYRNGEDVYVWQIVVIPDVNTPEIHVPNKDSVNDKVSITRIVNGHECSICLTWEEIERVFRYQDMEYMKEDARYHLMAYVDHDEEGEELKAEFKERFGLDFDELINNEDELETLANDFSEEQDCNVDENSTWDYVIDEYLKAMKPATTGNAEGEESICD